MATSAINMRTTSPMRIEWMATMILTVMTRIPNASSLYDSHHDAHKDNTFLATAHAYAQAQGKHSCWVCGLLPTSSDTYPYLAVPFTLVDYVTAYKKTTSPFYRADVILSPRPTPHGPPEWVKISYAPKGLLCWTNNGTGMPMGHSGCEYEIAVGQQSINITWHDHVENISLPDSHQESDVKVAMNGTMFVCGKHAYSHLPQGWKGACYEAYVVPAMRIGGDVRIDHKAKRDLFNSHEVVATPAQRFFAAIVPNYGVTVALDEIREVASIMDKIANDTAGALSAVNGELHAVRKVALQNRMALDIVLADKGGTCAILKQECCTYIPDSSKNISAYIQDIYTNVQRLKRPPGWNGWIDSWGGYSGIFQMIMSVIIPILSLYAIVKVSMCIVVRMTTRSPLLAPIKFSPPNIIIVNPDSITYE